MLHLWTFTLKDKRIAEYNVGYVYKARRGCMLFFRPLFPRRFVRNGGVRSATVDGFHLGRIYYPNLGVLGAAGLHSPANCRDDLLPAVFHISDANRHSKLFFSPLPPFGTLKGTEILLMIGIMGTWIFMVFDYERGGGKFRLMEELIEEVTTGLGKARFAY